MDSPPNIQSLLNQLLDSQKAMEHSLSEFSDEVSLLKTTLLPHNSSHTITTPTPHIQQPFYSTSSYSTLNHQPPPTSTTLNPQIHFHSRWASQASVWDSPPWSSYNSFNQQPTLSPIAPFHHLSRYSAIEPLTPQPPNLPPLPKSYTITDSPPEPIQPTPTVTNLNLHSHDQPLPFSPQLPLNAPPPPISDTIPKYQDILPTPDEAQPEHYSEFFISEEKEREEEEEPTSEPLHIVETIAKSIHVTSPTINFEPPKSPALVSFSSPPTPPPLKPDRSFDTTPHHIDPDPLTPQPAYLQPPPVPSPKPPDPCIHRSPVESQHTQKGNTLPVSSKDLQNHHNLSPLYYSSTSFLSLNLQWPQAASSASFTEQQSPVQVVNSGAFPASSIPPTQNHSPSHDGISFSVVESYPLIQNRIFGKDLGATHFSHVSQSCPFSNSQSTPFNKNTLLISPYLLPHYPITQLLSQAPPNECYISDPTGIPTFSLSHTCPISVDSHACSQDFTVSKYSISPTRVIVTISQPAFTQPINGTAVNQVNNSCHFLFCKQLTHISNCHILFQEYPQAHSIFWLAMNPFIIWIITQILHIFLKGQINTHAVTNHTLCNSGLLLLFQKLFHAPLLCFESYRAIEPFSHSSCVLTFELRKSSGPILEVALIGDEFGCTSNSARRSSIKEWDPGDQLLVFTMAWLCQFKQWDPGKFVIASIFLQP